MSDLSAVEKRKLERTLRMESGYVLDFSNRTFAEFFLDVANIDIYGAKYEHRGSSKANRMRAFWEKEDDPVVAKVLEQIFRDWGEFSAHGSPAEPPSECLRIVERLKSNARQTTSERSVDNGVSDDEMAAREGSGALGDMYRLQAVERSLEDLLKRARLLDQEYESSIRQRGNPEGIDLRDLPHVISFSEVRIFDMFGLEILESVLPPDTHLLSGWYVHGELDLDSPDDLVHGLLVKRAIVRQALSLCESMSDRAPKGGAKRPATILFVSADPTDEARLRLDQEFRDIREKLQLSRHRDRFVLAMPVLSARVSDVSQALLGDAPAIVHFSGHGTRDGSICLEDSAGLARDVTPEAIAALFRSFAGQVECVVLNACHSESQAQAIAQEIGCAIGMNDAIGDDAAIAFSVGFYQALGAGRDYAGAFGLGVAQVHLQCPGDERIPVLY